MVFCCEGNTLSPHVKCTSPAHPGFKFKTKGELLIKAAPVISMASGLLKLASGVGKLAGLPIPSELPFIGSVADMSPELIGTMDAYVTSIAEAAGAESADLGGIGAVIEERVEVAEEKLEQLVGPDDLDEETIIDVEERAEKVASLTRLGGAAYDAMREICESDPEVFGNVLTSSSKGGLTKAMRQDTGHVVWLCDAHLAATPGLVKM
mmetsp:Transcript_148363/g.360151  ORF Transcript_148363/g.360151 Transcript_148363/m.360151 type:complete len:208 (+) Transcript_148363:1-624(+)